jgi:HEAT repeats
MTWARWQGTLSAALFGVGVALGQGSDPSSGAMSHPESTVTVRESGKPDVKCRIARACRQPNGMMAYDVQAIDSGEWMTVVEAGPSTAMSETANGTCIRGVTSQIYHWGQKAPSGIDVSAQQQANQTVGINDRGIVQTPMIQQMQYTTEAPASVAVPPNAVATPAPMPAPTMETMEMKPEHHGPIMRMVRKLTGKDSGETPMVMQPTPESRPMVPGTPPEFDLGGAGSRSVTAAGEGLDKMRFDVPGPGMPMPNSTPPMPPQFAPYTMPPPQRGNYPGMQSMAAAQAASQTQMANAFSGGSPMPPMPSIDPNAFHLEEDGSGNMLADSGRRERFFGRLFHRSSSDAPTPQGGAQDVPMGGPTEGTAMAAATGWTPGARPNLPEPGRFPQQGTMISAAVVSTPVSRPAVEVSADCQQLVATLHNSLLPSERETAAESLGNAEGHSSPAVMAELLRSAREDPAPAVRCACVRCLVKMNAGGGMAVATLQALKNDADPQVRATAQEALAAVGSRASPMQAIQPASFTTSTPAR